MNPSLSCDGHRRSKSGSTVAQTWQVRPRNPSRPVPPLDAAALERLALGYAGRYATSRAKLRDYLRRKLRERGWGGEGTPPIDAVVERFAELGYVDDQAVAEARGRVLTTRGYGVRRIGQALGVLGIEEQDAAGAMSVASESAWQTALRFAERKRLGPYATRLPDERDRQRAFGAMARAGHATEHIRKILKLAPGDVPNED